MASYRFRTLLGFGFKLGFGLRLRLVFVLFTLFMFPFPFPFFLLLGLFFMLLVLVLVTFILILLMFSFVLKHIFWRVVPWTRICWLDNKILVKPIVIIHLGVLLFRNRNPIPATNALIIRRDRLHGPVSGPS
jgi:hypothetical protein